MTNEIEQAFNLLLKNWKIQDKEYKKKYETYKSRYLNRSGKQTKKVSPDKMEEMLEQAGCKIEKKIKVRFPKKWEK